MVVGLLCLSILFQVIAAVFALRLIRPSRGRVAWVVISLAFLLRAVRLVYQFILYHNPLINYEIVFLDEFMGMLISLLFAVGVYWIRPLFDSFQQAEEAREIYAHTISHDLRGPLTVIQGYSEFLREELQAVPLDENCRAGLKAIQHSSERMNALIQDMVDATRCSGKTLELHIESLLLEDFFPRLLSSSILGNEQNRIKIEILPEATVIMADRDRLERVVMNLLSNALKYSSASVLLRVARVRDNIVFSVQDSGPGIPTGDLPRIFDRFFRAGGNRTHEGIGLGLFIVRLLVEAHGGKIWVESRVGEGSTFFFTLPGARA